jgi:NAD-dependent DNA ligase
VFEGGFSIKRLEKIVTEIPDILFLDIVQIRKKLSSIGGFNKLIDNFIEGVDKYKKFIRNFPVKKNKKRVIADEEKGEIDDLSNDIETKLVIQEEKKVSKEVQKLIQSVVFTGSHPKDLIALVEAYGGSVKGATSKKTSVVVVADMSIPPSASRKKGEEYKIKVMSVEEFRKTIENA